MLFTRSSLLIGILSLAAVAARAEGKQGTAANESQFRDSLGRHALENLEQLAREKGPTALSALLQSSDPIVQRAAAMGVRGLEEAGTSLLPELAKLAREPDRVVALAALESALFIVASLDKDILESREIPMAFLKKSQRSWALLANYEGAWPDLRVLALEIFSRLDSLVASAAKDEDAVWESFLASASTPVFEAALDLLPLRFYDSPTIRLKFWEQVPARVASAGGHYCSLSALGTSALSSKEHEQLAKVASDKTLSLHARLQLLPCLPKAEEPLAQALTDLARRAKKAQILPRPSKGAVESAVPR